MRKAWAVIGPAVLLYVCSAAGSTGQTTLLGQDTVFEQNGIRYAQRTEPVRQPTTSVTWQERKEMAYREEYRTEYVETQRTVLVPVTEYQWEPRVHHWWNPLVPNTIAYHMVPRTRWEPRTHTVRFPQSRRELVPVERTVRVPTRHLGFEDQQRTTITALGPASESSSQPTAIANSGATSSQPAASVARQRGYVGGVQRLEGDLPRQSTRPGGVTQYR